MDSIWQQPPQELNINSQEVHLWKMNLETSSINIQDAMKILNEEETIKAQKFRFEKHQKRFIVARSTLKHILSHYLGISPEKIAFQYGSHGKPKLVDKMNTIQLEFNLSHSEELAIYGITCHHLIGVDVEYLRPMPDAEKLAKRFFCHQEFEKINSLSIIHKNTEFFKLWTAKEAYLKATGKGISGGLDKVEISTDEPRKFINLPQPNKTTWKLLSFVPQTNYLAAMAVQENNQITHYWQL